MPRQHRVTIKEIARMTGVSVQTVSRVINKRPDVSPETRAAVQAAIVHHGFQPSAVARSLVRRRSQMIGIIAAGLKYFGVAQTLNGAAQGEQVLGGEARSALVVDADGRELVGRLRLEEHDRRTVDAVSYTHLTLPTTSRV